MAQKRLNPKAELITVTIFAAIFFCSGIALTYFFHIKYLIINSNVRSNWVQTPCTINTLSLQSKKRINKPGKSKKLSYVIQTDFSYDYQGKTYTGDTYNYQQNLASRMHKIITQRLDEFRQLKPATCYVNPDKPDQAILDPRISYISYLPLSMGILFILIAIPLFIKQLKIYKKRTS